jgi:hypothetical protein
MALLLRGCVAPVGHAAFRRAELLPRRRSSSRLVTVASAAASSAPSSGDGAATAAPPSDAQARSDAAVAGANGAVVAATSRSTLIETTVERVRLSSFVVLFPSRYLADDAVFVLAAAGDLRFPVPGPARGGRVTGRFTPLLSERKRVPLSVFTQHQRSWI